MKSKISTAVSQIPLSGIREMWQRAAQYDSYISLGIGEPDFNTPKEICNQALQDALKGATHYTLNYSKQFKCTCMSTLARISHSVRLS